MSDSISNDDYDILFVFKKIIQNYQIFLIINILIISLSFFFIHQNYDSEFEHTLSLSPKNSLENNSFSLSLSLVDKLQSEFVFKKIMADRINLINFNEDFATLTKQKNISSFYIKDNHDLTYKMIIYLQDTVKFKNLLLSLVEDESISSSELTSDQILKKYLSSIKFIIINNNAAESKIAISGNQSEYKKLLKDSKIILQRATEIFYQDFRDSILNERKLQLAKLEELYESIDKVEKQILNRFYTENQLNIELLQESLKITNELDIKDNSFDNLTSIPNSKNDYGNSIEGYFKYIKGSKAISLEIEALKNRSPEMFLKLNELIFIKDIKNLLLENIKSNDFEKELNKAFPLNQSEFVSINYADSSLIVSKVKYIYFIIILLLSIIISTTVILSLKK